MPSHSDLVHRALGNARGGRVLVVEPDGTERVLGSGDDLVGTLRIHDPSFYRTVILHGEIGLGEAYMDGLWDSDDVEALLSWLVRNFGDARSGRELGTAMRLYGLFNRLQHKLRPNTRAGARRNIASHYDRSNDFFRLWLDPTMTYSTALFLSAKDDLVQAQLNKHKSVCTRLGLQPGHRVLDIGCGWGAFAIYAALHHDCRVTAITLSVPQAELAQARVHAMGLDDCVDVLVQDWRDLDGVWDRVVSLGMIPHLGESWFGRYFDALGRLVDPDGAVVLDSVMALESDFADARDNPSWTERHIFPGGMMPSVGAIARACEQSGALDLFHVEGMSLDYGRTMQLWRRNLLAARESVLTLGLAEREFRKWSYWLAGGVANFGQRNLLAAQVVLAPRFARGLAEHPAILPYGSGPSETLLTDQRLASLRMVS